MSYQYGTFYPDRNTDILFKSAAFEQREQVRGIFRGSAFGDWLLFSIFLTLLAGCQYNDRRNGNDPDSGSDTGSEIDTGFPSGAIPTTCDEAAENPTSVGCEFFLADLDNYHDADGMPFAVVVANPQVSAGASVALSDGDDNEIFTVTLAPGQLEVIPVACQSGCLFPPHEVNLQGLAPGAGFRLDSDVPVVAYQWNVYAINEIDADATTDASLLLPTSSLGGDYVLATWGEGYGDSSTGDELARSQMTLIATADGTAVTFVPSVDIMGANGIGPYPAGVETEPISLNTFDVLTVAPMMDTDDLTGTVLHADKRVAVFGSHSCATTPTGEYAACSHVEEQMPPLLAWGTSAVLARYAPRENCLVEDAALWRIVAGADDMRVSFDPAAPWPANSEIHFAKRGDVVEFMGMGDYYAEGTFESPTDPAHPEAPFLAYQLMTGSTYTLCAVAGPDTGTEGDPMMMLAPPAGQYLNRYVFNTPVSFPFDYDHIIIVRPAGAQVALDCLGLLPDDLFAAVGSSGWEVARVFIDNMDDTTGCEDGTHLLTASQPVGLSVVGVARANAYGYLGGIGVMPINPAIE